MSSRGQDGMRKGTIVQRCDQEGTRVDKARERLWRGNLGQFAEEK